MTKIHVLLTTVLMLIVVASTSLAQSADKSGLVMNSDKYQWKLEDTEDGCQIYTSKVAGKEYIAAKATCVIPARIEVIGVVIRDIPASVEWMDDVKEAKILQTVDDEKDVFIFWIRQHIPLLTDRDAVLKSEPPEIRPGFSDIRFGTTKEMTYDADKGYVRMPSLSSEIILEWVDREHTKVTYMNDPDLGKGLPKGMTNSQIKKNPFNSLKGLKKMVKLQKYIDSAKTSKYAKVVEDGIKDGTLK
jgi:hypothetical protein